MATDVTLEWDPNTEGNIAGYRVHWGLATRTYTSGIDAGKATTRVVTGLNPGVTYYLAVTAYNTEGLESDFSNELVYTPSGNRPPVAADDVVSIAPATLTRIDLGRMLRNDYDWDGDQISIATISRTTSQNGSLSLWGGLLYYISPPGFEGFDTFTYTVTDGVDLSQVATVTLNVQPRPKLTRPPSAILPQADGSVIVKFAGFPGGTYNVEASSDLVEWVVLGQVTSDTLGLAVFHDVDAGQFFTRLYQIAIP